MKVITVALILILVIAFFSGCEMNNSDNHIPTESVTMPSKQQETTPLPSEVGEILDFSNYSESELIEYFSSSDGAYAEGSIAELSRRFFDNPQLVIAELAAEGQDNQDLVSFHLVAYILGDDTEAKQLGALLSELGDTLNEQEKLVLDNLIAVYRQYGYDID